MGVHHHPFGGPGHPQVPGQGPGAVEGDGKKKKAKATRAAGGEKWHDASMDDWDKSGCPRTHPRFTRNGPLPARPPRGCARRTHARTRSLLAPPVLCAAMAGVRPAAAPAPDDFRIFVGDLGNEVSEEGLARAFQKYPSFLRAKVIKDSRSGKSKGYGFVSLKEGTDFIKAMKEMNGEAGGGATLLAAQPARPDSPPLPAVARPAGRYIGNRPIKLRRSTWKDRELKGKKGKGKGRR